MGAEELTAVVLNWRTPELTRRAVESLIEDGVPAARIVVVDNGSGDGSAADARRGPARAYGSWLSRRTSGSRAATTAGAAALPGAGYLFVNSDAFVARAGSAARCSPR